MKTAANLIMALQFLLTRLTIRLLRFSTLLFMLQMIAFPSLAEALVPVSSSLSAESGATASRGDRAIFMLRSDEPMNYYVLAASASDRGLTFRDTPLQLGEPVYLIASGALRPGEGEIRLEVPLPLTLPEGTYYLQGAFAADSSFETDVSLTNGIAFEVSGNIPNPATVLEVGDFLAGVAVNPIRHEVYIAPVFSRAFLVDLLSGTISEPFEPYRRDLKGIDVDIELQKLVFIGTYPRFARPPPVNGDIIAIFDLNTFTTEDVFNLTAPSLFSIKIHQGLHKAVISLGSFEEIILLNLITQELTRFPISPPARLFASDENSGSMYIAHFEATPPFLHLSFVTEFSLINHSVVRTLDLGMRVDDIAVSNRLGRLYAVSSEDNLIRSFDLETGGMISQKTFPSTVAPNNIGIAINDNAGIGAASLITEDLTSIVLFDLASLDLLNEFALPGPHGVIAFDNALNILVGTDYFIPIIR